MVARHESECRPGFAGIRIKLCRAVCAQDANPDVRYQPTGNLEADRGFRYLRGLVHQHDERHSPAVASGNSNDRVVLRIASSTDGVDFAAKELGDAFTVIEILDHPVRTVVDVWSEPGDEGLGIEVIDEAHFNCVVRAGVGMIKGNFNFSIEWQEMDAPGHAKMVANGKIPGSAVAMASTMDLNDDGDGGTIMNWSSDVRVSGTIAGVGARLMSGVADRQTKEIFDCIKSKLETA